MSGLVGHVGSRSGVIGQQTNNYLNSQTFAQTDGFVDNPHFYGFKFLGFHSAGSTGVTLASGGCGIFIGQHNDGGTWNRRMFGFWKRCNGGASYADIATIIHESGSSTPTAMTVGIDGSHVLTITSGSGNMFVYAQSG